MATRPSVAAHWQRVAILLCLALQGVTTRERVISVFWRESEPERARHALRQTLYDLRRSWRIGWDKVWREHMIVSDAVDVDAELSRALFGPSIKKRLCRQIAENS